MNQENQTIIALNDARITHAIVYPDEAWVQRKSTSFVRHEGLHSVILKGIPATCNPKSFR